MTTCYASRLDHLRAILDRPDDDGVRLVYADRLEEDGQAVTADLIRVQVRLAAAPAGPAADALREREAALLADLRAAFGWDGWGTGAPQFDRGLLGPDWIDLPDFLRHGPGLTETGTVLRLNLWEFNPDLPAVEALAACPALARVLAVDLGCCFTSRQVPALARSPHLGGVEELRLQWRPWSPDALPALAGALGGLRRLVQAVRVAVAPG